MGKKKAFIVKKAAERFRLIPGSATQDEVKTDSFKPSKDQLDEQRKFGVFYDDDYNYMQHLRDRNESSVMLSLDETTTVVRAPAMPLPSDDRPRKVMFDDDLNQALEGVGVEEGDLDDNFINMAGGVLEDKFLIPHLPRGLARVDSDEEDDEDEDDFGRGYEDYDMDEDEEEEEGDGTQHESNRDVDAAFDALLDADYCDDQVGELEGEAVDIQGGFEPSDSRVRRLVGEKRGLPEYREDVAKQYVRDRMAYLEKHGEQDEKDMEEVEVEVSASKRIKWDCESFATQYTNIYNHPSLIKEPPGRLSRRALRRLERESVVEAEEEEDEDMDDDDESVCTTATTIRPRGETTEERKARKAAIKDARRSRRVEKKENKTAFALEHRKAVVARLGQIKSKPVV